MSDGILAGDGDKAAPDFTASEREILFGDKPDEETVFNQKTRSMMGDRAYEDGVETAEGLDRELLVTAFDAHVRERGLNVEEMSESEAEIAFLNWAGGVTRARNGEGGSERDKAVVLIDEVRRGKVPGYLEGDKTVVARVNRAFEAVYGKGRG